MKSITTKYIFFPVLVLLCLAGLASCDYIHDELPLCRHTLRFVYRHNIKHADAFAYEMENQEAAKNVRLYIYSAEGKFLSSRLIEGEELKKNEVDLSELDPGDYRLLAWAGLNAQDYTWTEPAPGSSIDDFRMSVQMVENRVDRELSGLFQGELEYTIPVGGTTDTEFPLVKNTNKIRFILIDANRGTKLTSDAFDFAVTTTNGDLDAHNEPVSPTRITWLPYLQQVEEVKASGNETTKYEAVCTELNMLRLIDNNTGTLRIRYASEKTPFINVSLTELLKLTQIASHKLPGQEYLDRQDEYVITAYVDIVGGRAHCLEVIVDDWIVRLEDLTLGNEEMAL
ncbi:FimB/Mfa2 family fimbrial subunit [Parabacteroides sp. BX2]|jgi:hypothetical protein|uniref:FimB/Mfa2 family fimbrial subunit n=1 Tax=Parabacteroides segnis TaxID=2763058 RepID=A0ABR7DZ72_9BACT|nr:MULTISPECIES: FimB/Mfa2 family fimbrial subunit [Parabacteroides]MBC5642713.1 FimB/Mfa2 family fimbrial subunit [Parabacteroides segnis]MCM0715752.1 FimB/Mfa2 family fimbrial subunit [Parabacteroides sp. TA-V-105]